VITDELSNEVAEATEADDAVDGAAPAAAPPAEAEQLFAEIEAELPHDAPAIDYQDADSDLDEVALTLGFELGTVSLQLAEVRTLGRGAVLQLSGGSPASVAIVAGGRTLGRGEIVDVEGQLGIRVTQWRTP
jgi:type III secretion system YscQ/HrcQ family protein